MSTVGSLRGADTQVMAEVPLAIRRQDRWLLVEFAQLQRTMSWAIVGGGLRTARAVAWHEVSNSELDADTDAEQLLRERLATVGMPDAVGLLTSRYLAAYQHVTLQHDGCAAQCIATVGLGNAVRIGEPAFSTRACSAGTINVLCYVSTPITESALLEAMALVAEAKTAAVYEAGFTPRGQNKPVTGTGTDCIVVACPAAASADRSLERYAGKHTLVGHLVGASAYEAIRRGVEVWLDEQGRAQTPAWRHSSGELHKP